MIANLSLARVRHLLLFAGITLFCSMAAFGRNAVVRSVKGSPKYVVAGIPTPLAPGDRLPPGAVVKTGENDTVDLVVGEQGKLISVGPNSQLRVQENDRVLILEKGEIIGSVRASKSKMAADAEPLTIQSPLGVTKVGAADFSVNTYDNSLRVLSGKDVTHEPVLRASDVRAGQSAMQISPGMGMFQGANGASMAPLGASANNTLMQKVDRLVTTDSKGGPTIRAAMSVCLSSPEPYPNPGTGTPGYWKTHPEAWPSATIVIGGQTYTIAQATSYMGTTKKDRTYTMFQDLVSAELNVRIGNDPSCIASVIASANAWMTSHPIGSRVFGSSTAWVQGDPIHQQLDQYNNGLLCAPHRN